MRYLTLDEVLELHRLRIDQSGGSHGIREHGLLISALAQPQLSFGGQELYPTLADQAAAMAFSLIMNHPFVDDNKRMGQAGMEAFLVVSGHEMVAGGDEQEGFILRVAAGAVEREKFTQWVKNHTRELSVREQEI